MGWEFCAREHGFYYAHGAIIHYGRDGAFTCRRSPPGCLPSVNRVFGDPLVGIHKLCLVSYLGRRVGEARPGEAGKGPARPYRNCEFVPASGRSHLKCIFQAS